ncbi:S-adenosyl-L-methionine-dependent methyltransferase [Aspergillus aurantiobrunneus]
MSSNGISGANPDLGDVDGHLEKVTQSINSFKAGQNEKDRLAAIRAAQQLARALHKPKDNVYHQIYSTNQAMCVRMGIDLEIFSTLSKASGPVTLNELAAVTGADPFMTERVLRVLAGIEYVAEQDVHVYTPTRMTHQMTDRCSIAMVKFIYDFGVSAAAKTPEFLRKHDYAFLSGVTSGPFQYAHNHSLPMWEWMAEDEERLDLQNSFMEADRGSRPPWVDWFPVEQELLRPRSVSGGDEDVFMVDVAGGRGHDLQLFKERFPQVNGRFILEDVPHVLEQSVYGLQAEKLAFDLFKSQPVKGARIYYMKFILHDWSDAECVQILKHIRDAMKPGYSTLIIEEFILPERDCPVLPGLWDWMMLAFLNSFERSDGHWRKLLAEAGFKPRFVYPPGDGMGLILAEPEGSS